MKLKTRLKITFATIIFLPLFLAVVTLLIYGIYIVNVQKGLQLSEIRYSIMTENLQEFVNITDASYEILLKQAWEDSSKLEDIDYLESVSAQTARSATFIIVRKGDALYYTSNNVAAREIFDKLPAYGDETVSTEFGIYYAALERYVKQIDFVFSDGAAGSVFVVAKINLMISRHLLIGIMLAITIILIFTSIMLTRWIQKGVFDPINQLGIAMRKIKEGNFDYTLETDADGEMGDLYRNYEDMRLRLKESTEENLENQRQHKELISNITHDLKTPITSIKGYVEGILDGVADTPQKQEKYLRTVYNKANDMDRLITELTIYSSVDNNRIPYNFQCINVADYFNDCFEEVGLDLDSKGILLDYVNVVSNDVLVIADPEQMKKVINNIISNSVKYMDKTKKVIAIRVLDAVDSVQIEIEDNGKGIAHQDLQRIFDRFYRTDASRNSAQGGSGIGLSIVKKIVEDHGGYIWATSKEGEGTCMHFVLRKYEELEPRSAKI